MIVDNEKKLFILLGKAIMSFLEPDIYNTYVSVYSYPSREDLFNEIDCIVNLMERKES